MDITEEELKELPRKVGRMTDEMQLYQLLADCRMQILFHSTQVESGVPCPGCRWSRAALDELRLGSLRAIVREHKLDPSGKLAQQNDAEKLRAAILKAARKRRA